MYAYLHVNSGDLLQNEQQLNSHWVLTDLHLIKRGIRQLFRNANYN